VNPRKLPSAARDSVCEQCHLAGVTRVLNPGKNFADFHAGQALEDVFTVYVHAATSGTARAFKVISHAEQFARSMCVRQSEGRLWCGTCHNPHPLQPASTKTYNAVCLSCHAGKLAESHTAAPDCVSCHMPPRRAQDGGHTVFTAHRIARRPAAGETGPQREDLAAWRECAPSLRQRNTAIANLNAGIASRSPAQIVRSYRMLVEVEKTSPDDIAILKGIGRALLLGKEPLEALRALDRVLQLVPKDAGNEEAAGLASLESGQLERAARHLERAVELDPLLISATTELQEVFRRQGRNDEAQALAHPWERSRQRQHLSHIYSSMN
jgi:hypothetical protein